MQVDKIIQEGLKYAETNLAVSISGAVILLFLLYRKPKIIFTLVLIALGAAGVLELFEMLESAGLTR